MQVEFSAHYILAEHLNQLSTAALDSSIPGGFEPEGGADLKILTDPSTDTSGVTRFQLEVTRTLLRRMDVMQVFSAVRGLGPQQAGAALSTGFPLRKESEIALTPSWWPWLPIIPFNLSVEMR
jgi:hypothetical protein